MHYTRTETECQVTQNLLHLFDTIVPTGYDFLACSHYPIIMETLMKPENLDRMRCRLTRDNSKEFPKLHTLPLPPLLRDIYGGDLQFVIGPGKLARPVTFLNFVTDRDGVFNMKHKLGGGPVSRGNEADAFGMALLRSVADAVMVGAGTVNGEPDHKWHTDFIFDVFPQMKGKEQLRAAFKAWRRELGKTDEHPPTYFMTNSGKVDFTAAVFKDAQIKKYIVTGAKGAKWLRSEGGMTRQKLEALNTEVLEYGGDTLDADQMMREIREFHGVEYLLHEGGRSVAAALVEQHLVDQLFLTQMSHSLADDEPADQMEYLLSTSDHQLPAEAHVLSVRDDAVGAAHLWAVSLENVPRL